MAILIRNQASHEKTRAAPIGQRHRTKKARSQRRILP